MIPAAEIGPKGGTFVTVGDRESDMFSHFDKASKAGRHIRPA
jgi:hypothetical protein